MNTEAIVHPSEILYDMLLQLPRDLLQITNYDLFKNIILNKKDLIEKDCEFLAKVFCTSKKIEKLNKYLGYSIQLGKVENVPDIFGEAQEPSNECD